MVSILYTVSFYRAELIFQTSLQRFTTIYDKTSFTIRRDGEGGRDPGRGIRDRREEGRNVGESAGGERCT